MEMINETDLRRPWLSLRLGVAIDSELGNHIKASAIFEQVAKVAEISGNTQLLTLSKAHLCQSAMLSSLQKPLKHSRSRR